MPKFFDQSRYIRGVARGQVNFYPDRIVIADDGVGVSCDIKEQIFDPFFTTRDGGTGLGLAVVQAVTLDHGGSVTCLDNPQDGATFELSLPRLRSDAEVWSKRK